MNESMVISLSEVVIGISGICTAAYFRRREDREIDKRNHWKSKETIGGDLISEGI